MKKRTQMTLRHARRGVRVLTEWSTHLDWLSECLEPHFSSSTSGEADWQVTFSVSKNRYDALLACGGDSSGQRIPFFALDSRLVELPRWRGAGKGRLVAYDDEFRVFYIVSRRTREIEVLAREAGLWTRVALMRVVREHAMEACARAGGVCLHAAAFEADGKVFLLAGPKNAGKSTLLVHALSAPATRFVSNDRAIVLRGRQGLQVRGMPTLVRVRAGTRRLLPGALQRVEWSADRACLTLPEWGSPAGAMLGPDDPIILNPAQFAGLLGREQSVGGALAAIIYPQVDVRSSGLVLRPMTTAQRARALASSMFRAHSDREVAGAFGGGSRGSVERGNCLRAMTDGVPMIRCSLGRDAFVRPGGATALVESLLAWER